MSSTAKLVAAWLILLGAAACQHFLVASPNPYSEEAAEVTLAYIQYEKAETKAEKHEAKERLRQAIVAGVGKLAGQDIESVVPGPESLLLVNVVFQDEPEERVYFFAQVLTLILQPAQP